MVMAGSGLSRIWPPQDYGEGGDQETTAWETPAPTLKSPRDLGPKPLSSPGHVPKKPGIENLDDSGSSR